MDTSAGMEYYRRTEMLSASRMVNIASCLALLVLLVASAQGQREARAGGNYARVFEAGGGSPAARSLRDKLNVALRTAISRSSTPSGTRIVRRRTPAVQGLSPVQSPSSAVTTQATVVEAPSTTFRPDPSRDSMPALAEKLGSTPQEKLLLKQVFAATKTAFENEVAKKGRKNNLSAALTFFIGSTVWVYHNGPEPSDAALDNLWDGLEGAFEGTPEISKMTDEEKQLFYDTLIAFSGIVLATYNEAKTTNNTQELLIAQTLAGGLIQLVLKSDPEKLKFTATGVTTDQ